MSELAQSPEITESLSRQLRAKAELDKLVQHSALTELTHHFGFEPSEDANRLKGLQQFMAQNWESRDGAERQAVNWDDPEDEAGQAATQEVFEQTGKLGMVESSHPDKDHYDYLTILGGANKAPYDRLRYGLEQGATFDHIVLLGSGRKVSPAEREKAKDYAPDARTEYDLMNGAVESHYLATEL